MSNVNGIHVCTYFYTITIVFLSTYSKAKTVLGMLCRDKSIIALIIGQYMKYRPRKRPRGTSVFYSFYISYNIIDLFNRAIIDTYWRYTNILRGDKRVIIVMKSMSAADITTQYDNLFKVLDCVFPESIFKLRSSVEIRFWIHTI